MTRFSVAILGLALLALGLTAIPATAYPPTSAECAYFTPTGACTGHLEITGAPGTQFTVAAQQYAGNYAPVASGVIGSDGSAAIDLPKIGPSADCKPQYRVQMVHSDCGPTIICAVATGPEDQIWWLD